jgi:UDP-2,3-diacylglucosamine hydrolase
MRVIFLADAHLKRTGDKEYRILMQFLDSMTDIDRLFIVGDFFDFWFYRDGRVYPEFYPIIEKLIYLRDKGISIVFCEGNHDFYMKDYFSDELKMMVYTEGATVHLDGRKIFLSHGDTVDRTNKKYLFLRKILRSKAFYHCQKMIPLALIWRLARLSSRTSKELTVESQDLIAEKMEAFSRGKFQEGFDAVIMGHCHKPLIKESMIEDRKRTFATVGDWVKHYSYIYYEEGIFTLKYFPESVTAEIITEN